MSRFHAYTRFKNPGLHVWREGTSTKLYLRPALPPTGPGWVEFEYGLEPGILNDVCFMLFDFDEAGDPGRWEKDEHQRKVPRDASGHILDDIWFAQDARRVLTSDPRQSSATQARLHLISQRRYRPSQLFLWDSAKGIERRVALSGEDNLGPFFDVSLLGDERSFFLFKFIRQETGEFRGFEPDFANRLWCAADGNEIWTHSDAAEIASAEPQKKKLSIHFRQELSQRAQLHYWQENSDFSADVDAVAGVSPWVSYEAALYTGLGYGLRFRNPDLGADAEWESPEAIRQISISQDTEIWTLEGDSTVFPAEPQRDQQLNLTIATKPPGSALTGKLSVHVWINRARAPIIDSLEVGADGRVSVLTYPKVVTSLKFRDEHGRWETIRRHSIKGLPSGGGPVARHVVLDRPPLLEAEPPLGLFQNPPFNIRRPGAYAEDGNIHFAVHAPAAARMRVIGPWTNWEQNALEMRSTTDGAYWWARVSIQDILSELGRSDYHGVEYQFLVNDSEKLQDPAAGWVSSSWNQDVSKLVQRDKFAWGDAHWRRPGWEHLNIYQIHVSRFSNRFPNDAPLRRVAREVESGYLRDLGITAILVMPLNEVGTENSWGYDPAFFYAIENDFGGPDALKELVDTCHRHGVAVLLDVVFNHAGSTDNILWSLARESFFDGDTRWGAMINFDHPQCRLFFAQNLVYLARDYHLDGFRLDHTATIVHSNAWDQWSGFVREQGSGGGWDFLHAIRRALHEQVDPLCILMAEHLPNEWSLTNFGGPMDTQWCDDFHDRMVDACRRQFGMSRLAEAFKLSHTACDDWYKVTNYPESHDEVGNVRDRIAYVAGWGQGFRMCKVAAAGTLLSRGIPMVFMGAESGEDAQFAFGASTKLDLDRYLADDDRGRIRAWWRALSDLRRARPAIKGPAPLAISFAEGQLLAILRGQRGDYFAVLNFGGWSGAHNLGYLNLPNGTYRELWNSTWPAFAIAGESEGEHTNGGRDARLRRSDWLQIPDYGAVILERVD
jgi:1,4-alpha-glucan branching enzyme